MGERPSVPIARATAGASIAAAAAELGRTLVAGHAPGRRRTGGRERLLDRYGIVSREHVEAEAPPVAWRDLLDLYKAMELRGQVRRGYFVEGLSGAQFAWPAAVEALRADAPALGGAGVGVDPACAWGPLPPAARSPGWRRTSW